MKYSLYSMMFVQLCLTGCAGEISQFSVGTDGCYGLLIYFKLLVWGPIAEELVFRAGLQNWLMRHFNRPLIANGVTSFLFALGHYVVAGELLMWLTLLPSLVLGWAYAKTRSVGFVICLHAVLNMIFLLWICT